jgi:hypothetical protein
VDDKSPNRGLGNGFDFGPLSGAPGGHSRHDLTLHDVDQINHGGEVVCIGTIAIPKIPPVRLAHDIARDADQGGAASGSVVAVYVEVDLIVSVGAKRMCSIVYRVSRDVPLER